MITNEEVQRRMKCLRNVLQLEMERTLNLFGHISRMNNSRLIKQVVLGMVDGSGTQEDPTKSGSTTTGNGARWTCAQQAFWRNQELNGSSLWNAWLTTTGTEPRDRWIDGHFSWIKIQFCIFQFSTISSAEDRINNKVCEIVANIIKVRAYSLILDLWLLNLSFIKCSLAYV